MITRQPSMLIVPAALLMLVAIARPVAAQSLPITVSQYDKALSAAQRDAVDASSGSLSSQKAALTALEAVAQVPVRTASNELAFADNRPIIAQMQVAEDGGIAGEGPEKWTEIAVEIQEIRSALPTAAVDIRAEDSAAASARDLLSTPEFASEPIATNSIADKIGDAIARFLLNLRKMFHIPFGENALTPDWVTRIVPEVLLGIIATVAIGLIVYFIVTMIHKYANAARTMDSSDSGLALTSEERDLVATYNYVGLRALADGAAKGGDYRSAFRLTFLATLVYLNFEGAIKLDRSKTNWEYLRSLSEHPGLRDRLRPQVRDFDRIWYGLQDATEPDYDRAVATYESIRSIYGDSSARTESTTGGRALEKATGSR